MKKEGHLIKLVLLSVLLIVVAEACQQQRKKEVSLEKLNSSDYKIRYAKGFDIQYFEDYKKLIIKSPYPGSDKAHEYILNNSISADATGSNSISIPVERMIATSTTHVPMLEILGAEDRLVGFPNTDFITSEKTRSRVAEGQLTDIGKDMSLNAEMVIALQPDVLVAFALDGSDKAFSTLRKNGLPIVFNGDWLEETPLGRAEWIKFFGALLDLDQQADSIFNAIEAEYLEASEIAEKATRTPSVMSGVLFKDQWNLPAGESFTARLYRDANTNYLWKDSQGQGSLVLNFESVLETARDADLWIGSGIYTSRQEMLEANGHYAEFAAFKNRSVYTFSKHKGSGGGIVYFELAPIQPHIVLKDLVKVAHPELLPDYDPFFLQVLDR
jgi:iron complex transport system substrate-binding protein